MFSFSRCYYIVLFWGILNKKFCSVLLCFFNSHRLPSPRAKRKMLEKFELVQIRWDCECMRVSGQTRVRVWTLNNSHLFGLGFIIHVWSRHSYTLWFSRTFYVSINKIQTFSLSSAASIDVFNSFSNSMSEKSSIKAESSQILPNEKLSISKKLKNSSSLSNNKLSKACSQYSRIDYVSSCSKNIFQGKNPQV